MSKAKMRTRTIVVARSGLRFAFIAGLVSLAFIHDRVWAAACATPNADCVENASFVARVTDLRTSVSGRYRVVTAAMRIENKLGRPLILGYVHDSGVVTDDRGNRYVPYGENAVRGIGVIHRREVDPSFVLQPGEASDARFEFLWAPKRGTIIGTKFTMDLTLQELGVIAGDQYTRGAQRVLRFEDPAKGLAAGRAAAAAPVSASPAAAGPVSLQNDPCAGLARCAHGGPFVAEVISVTPGYAGSNNRHHVLKLNARFRNLSALPVVLAYKTRTSTATDNLGNTYYWGISGTHDKSASGIGTTDSRRADTSFQLNPGESRNASFQVTRYDIGKQPLGTSFAYDVVVEQLEILSAEQSRTMREYSLHFPDLAAGGSTATAPPADLNQAVQQLRDLFRKKD